MKRFSATGQTRPDHAVQLQLCAASIAALLTLV